MLKRFGKRVKKKKVGHYGKVVLQVKFTFQICASKAKSSKVILSRNAKHRDETSMAVQEMREGSTVVVIGAFAQEYFRSVYFIAACLLQRIHISCVRDLCVGL